jgi:hypothetical protein
VYAEYESKREKRALEHLKVIQEYIDHSDSICSTMADKTASVALENSISLSKLNLDF